MLTTIPESKKKKVRGTISWQSHACLLRTVPRMTKPDFSPSIYHLAVHYAFALI